LSFWIHRPKRANVQDKYLPKKSATAKFIENNNTNNNTKPKSRQQNNTPKPNNQPNKTTHNTLQTTSQNKHANKHKSKNPYSPNNSAFHTQSGKKQRVCQLPTSPSTSNFPTNLAKQPKPKTESAAQNKREVDYTKHLSNNELTDKTKTRILL